MWKWLSTYIILLDKKTETNYNKQANICIYIGRFGFDVRPCDKLNQCVNKNRYTYTCVRPYIIMYINSFGSVYVSCIYNYRSTRTRINDDG